MKFKSFSFFREIKSINFKIKLINLLRKLRILRKYVYKINYL